MIYGCETVLIEAANRRAEKLAAWYDKQSERLGLTREQLEAALLRGWCGEEISRWPAASADDLLGPPRDVDIEHLENRIRIRAADIKPVRGMSEDDRRRIESAHREWT